MVNQAQARTSVPLAPVVWGGAALVLGVTSTFATDDGPVLCLYRRCTGGYCPGCGGSRAVVSLVRGDIASAWSGHPWVVLIAVQVLALVVATLVLGSSLIRSVVGRVLVANAMLGVGIWVVRLGLGHVPLPFT